MMRTQPSLKTWRWLIRRLSLYRDREQRGDSIKLPPAPEYECGDRDLAGRCTGWCLVNNLKCLQQFQVIMQLMCAELVIFLGQLQDF